jgi:hypothetical protein
VRTASGQDVKTLDDGSTLKVTGKAPPPIMTGQGVDMTGPAPAAPTTGFDNAAGTVASTAFTPVTPYAGPSATGFTPAANLSPTLAQPWYAQAGQQMGDFLKTPQGMLTAGAFGMDLLKGNQTYPAQNQLEKMAGQMGPQGQYLQNMALSGQLPPGLQTAVDAAREAAISTVKSQMAARGMSGSSAEATEIQNAVNESQGQTQQMALQLFNSGMNESGMAADLYAQLLQTQMEQDKDMSDGLGQLVSAVAKFGQPVVAGGGGQAAAG